MADFMDPGNKMKMIIPAFFHQEFSKTFLEKTRAEISKFANNPPPEFKKDMTLLEGVLIALTDFTTDVCDLAHWCPEGHNQRLKAALKRL